MVKKYHRYSLDNIDAEDVLAEKFKYLILKRDFHSQHNRKRTKQHCPNFVYQQFVKSVKICKNICNDNNSKNT